MSRSFSQGEFPYWINSIVGGIPLYNSPQFSGTYPFYFLHFGWYANPVQALIQIHNLVFFHFFILYINSYVMLRVFRLIPLAALLGASVMALGSNMLGYGTWINSIAPYSWFPLVVGAVYLICENKYPRSGVLLGTVAFSLLILASPAQPLIHAVYVIGFLYICQFVRCIVRRNWKGLFEISRNLAIMGGLTALISSPSLLPAYLDTKNSIRFIGNLPAVIGDAKVPFEGVLVGQYQPIDLTRAVLPLKVPRSIGDPYIGLGAVFLALLAIFKLRRNWIVLPLLILALYGLLSSAGNNLGMAQINYELPFINKIREPGRHMVLYTLGVSGLLGFGFQYSLETFSQGYRVLLKWRYFAIAGLFITIIVMALVSGLDYEGAIRERWLFLASGVAVGLLLVISSFNAWKRQILIMLAAFLVFFVSLQSQRIVPRIQDGDYFYRANLVAHQTLAELSKIPDIKDYRVNFNDDELSILFWPMAASYYDLRSDRGYMNPLQYDQFSQLFSRENLHNYYPMLGVKYYLCSLCNEPMLEDYRLDREINGYKLYIAKLPLPHYSIFNQVGGAYKDANEFFGRIDRGYDYTKFVFLNKIEVEEVKKWLGTTPGNLNFTIKEESHSLNHITLSANTSEHSMFILNEFNSPDWQVKVNGQPTKIFRPNLNQIGVLLDKGGSLIEFEYHPSLFIVLLWLQSLVVLLLVLYLLLQLYKFYRSRTANRK